MTDKQIAAYDILTIIKKYAYSTEEKYVQYRVNNGSKGVIDAIIMYIVDTYFNN